MNLPNFTVIKRTITSVDSPDPYLMRWEFNTPWFTLKLHRFLRSDLAPLHDHPWWFLSFVLWGGYEEYLVRPTMAMDKAAHTPKLIRRRPLSVAFRQSTDRHRVDIGSRKRVWTFCLTGPKERSWYFYHEHPHLNVQGAPCVCGLKNNVVRVPWRVAVAYGENYIEEMVAGGIREAHFEDMDRELREREE